MIEPSDPSGARPIHRLDQPGLKDRAQRRATSDFLREEIDRLFRNPQLSLGRRRAARMLHVLLWAMNEAGCGRDEILAESRLLEEKRPALASIIRKAVEVALAGWPWIS